MKKKFIWVLLIISNFALHSQEEISYEKAKKLVTETNFLLDEKSVEINKEIIKASAPMIDLFLKYDDSTKITNQAGFDKILIKMGIMDEIQNDKSGLTKEDAFKFVNTYIRADQGNKIEIDEAKKQEVVSFINEIEKGKQDALVIFNDATTDVKMNQMRTEASRELYKSGFFRPNSVWFTYEEFEVLTLKEYPKATKGQIRAAYNYFIEQIKIGMGYNKK